MKNLLLIFSLFLSLISCNQKVTNEISVSDKSELIEATKNAKAGDIIVIKNGTYKDIEIVFKGDGTEKEPIILKAETAGKVFIEGVSSLEISGNYLQVSGLFLEKDTLLKKI